jgi:hypothetical protein
MITTAITKKAAGDVIVSFACNHARTGNFAGRAKGCTFETKYFPEYEVELDHDDWVKGTKFQVSDTNMVLTIHGVAYPFKRRKAHYGNLSWDGFLMKRPAAMCLLRALRDSKEWNCNSSPVHFDRWFDSVSGKVLA